MLGKLLAIFIGIPLLEVMILIKLGEVFGFWSTFLLVIVTGFLGAVLARLEGIRSWINIQNALRAGEMPAEEMVDALLILIAGILLITPGLLTDIVGFLLLISQTRFWFKRWLRRKFDTFISRPHPAPGRNEFFFFIE